MDIEVKLVEDPEIKGFGPALGITEERLDELMPAITAAMNSDESVAAMVSELSRHCEHANELAFVTFTLGAYYSSANDLLSRAIRASIGE